MTTRAVIFDLDGTLVDTLSDIANASNHVLERAGYPTHPLDAYRGFVGGGARVLVERALPRNALDQVDAILNQFGHHYIGNLIVDSAPYPGIVELLNELTSRAIPIAILSNKPHTMVTEIAETLFADVPFMGVHGQKPDVPKKPNPTAVIALAREMGLSPADIAYVGDSDVDIDTALAANMLAVGVAWGFRGAPELEARGATHVLQTPRDLLQLIG
jgi:phosphoglycolate phosphatase